MIRPVSKKRGEQLKIYKSLRQEFLKANPLCQNVDCPTLNGHRRTATEVHHSRGKTGTMLLQVKWFRALCSWCHRWVHDNPNKARVLGLLCEKGKWNCHD